MILNQDNSIVLIIDVQEKLLNAIFNKGTVKAKADIIAKAAALLNLPTFVTEQYQKGLGETITSVKDALKDAKYFEKVAFNALEDVNLLSELKSTGRKQIVLFGIETHICVHQTAAALIENGFDVALISDACGSRFENEYLGGISAMKQNGAFIKTTEIALFELLKSAKHPSFKEIQSLIK